MLEVIVVAMWVIFPIWAISAFVSRDKEPEPEPEEDDTHRGWAAIALLAALLFILLGFASVGAALVER